MGYIALIVNMSKNTEKSKIQEYLFMIDKIQRYTNNILQYTDHTIIGILIDGTANLIESRSYVINRVSLTIFSQVLISIPLFLIHHNLFVLGFVVGFVFDGLVREVAEKVNVVYNAQRTYLEKFLFYGGGIFLTLLTMPTSLIVATFYYSSQWGCKLYKNSLDHQRNLEAQMAAQNPAAPANQQENLV